MKERKRGPFYETPCICQDGVLMLPEAEVPTQVSTQP